MRDLAEVGDIKTIIKKTIRAGISCIVLSFFMVVRYLSFQAASRAGAVMGWLVFYLPLPARRIALKNLTRVFSGKSRSEVSGIARSAFVNQGRNLFELFTFASLNRQTVDDLVVLEGKESLEAAFARGKGVMILGSHFGNWELMGAALSLWGYPVSVIARKIYLDPVNRLLVGLRETAGTKVILRSEEGSPKKILRTLKRNEILGILIDQDAHVPGVWVDFFGIPAYTPSGLAALALKSGAVVVPGFIIREKGSHRVHIGAPLDMIRTGDHERDIKDNTQIFTGIIERFIRQYPDQWVWMHDRWKHSEVLKGS